MKRGLGKGLQSLIPEYVVEAEFDPLAKSDKTISRTILINITDVVPDPDQPRKHFDESALSELAESIKLHGLLQPIVVSEHGKDKYMIIAGERRYRASKLAGLNKISAIVRSPEKQTRLELSLVENLQRKNLNPLEIATSYLKLQSEFNLRPKDIAKKMSKAESTIVNSIRLLGLPVKIKQALIDGHISEGHARSILGVNDDKDREKLLDEIEKNKLSVRETEAIVSKVKKAGDKKVDGIKANHKLVETFKQKFGYSLKFTGGRYRLLLTEQELKKIISNLK